MPVLFASALLFDKNPPAPQIETTTPVTQNRDFAIYDWDTRHKQILERNKTVKPEIVFLGDSITHYWSGEPAAPIARSPKGWQEAFGTRIVTNLGFGWDRTENMLWRLRNGELEGIKPKLVVMLAGTNNLERNTAEEIAIGIDALCKEVHKKLPRAKILLIAIIPRADKDHLKANLDEVNKLVRERVSKSRYITTLDCSSCFVRSDGKLRSELFLDGLHPTDEGYQAMAKLIRPAVDKLLK